MKWLLGRRRSRPRRSRRLRIALLLGKAGAIVLGLSMLPTLCFRWIDPPTTAFMVQSRVVAHSEGREDYSLRQYWVGWAEIPAHAKLAVLAAEDQRFPDHEGFDLDSITAAVYERLKKRSQRGASTISQQVAKNLYLWPGQSFVRKGLEAYFTMLIEWLWPKERILEVYLNVAQFGDGVFGIEAASVKYFGKPAAELLPQESALLAAVLPNPLRYRADRPSGYVRERSQWILSQVKLLGGPAYLDELREQQ